MALILNNYEPNTRWVRIGLVLSSIVLAWLTYKAVETPIRTRSSISTRQIVGAFCFVAALAGAVVLFAGVPQRPANQDETRVFLDHYKKLHKFGLSDYYQKSAISITGTPVATKARLTMPVLRSVVTGQFSFSGVIRMRRRFRLVFGRTYRLRPNLLSSPRAGVAPSSKMIQRTARTNQHAAPAMNWRWSS